MRLPSVVLVVLDLQDNHMAGKKINGKRAKALLERGARLYDMRDAIAFRDGTLPGAHHVVLRRISEIFKLPKGTSIILFGHGYDDPDVVSAANYLEQYGYINVYNLGSKDEFSN
jgi:rhodanese-related sulfurtransferase